MATAKRTFTPALGRDVLTYVYDLGIRLTLPERRFKSDLIESARLDAGMRVLDVDIEEPADSPRCSASCARFVERDLGTQGRMRSTAIKGSPNKEECMVYRRSLCSLMVLLTVAACAPARMAQGERSGGAVTSYAFLVEHLRASGIAVEAAGNVTQPFFTPPARVIRLGTRGEAQVYEYSTEEQAAAEAARVKPDGSVGTSMPMWIAPPHFFRARNLIVLYLGSDDKTLLNLRGVLGAEFAGQT